MICINLLVTSNFSPRHQEFFYQTYKTYLWHITHLESYIHGFFLANSYLLGKSMESCTQNIIDTITLFDKLGFVVHPDKSILEPTQVTLYLEYQISSMSRTITLTEDWMSKTIASCLNIHDQPRVTIRELACLIDQLIAAFPGVMHGPLHHRTLERYKASAMKANKGNCEAKLALCEKSLREIEWWFQNLTTAHNVISHDSPSLVITSGASKS